MLLFGVLGKSKIARFGRFYKKLEFYLEGVWLWRISGGYSQEKRGSVVVEVARIKPDPPYGP